MSLCDFKVSDLVLLSFFFSFIKSMTSIELNFYTIFAYKPEVYVFCPPPPLQIPDDIRRKY